MTSDLCAADINLRVLMNALALAFRHEPAKRDAVLQLVADIRADLKLRPFTSPHIAPSHEQASAALAPLPGMPASAESWPVEFETTKLLVTRIRESAWDIRATSNEARAIVDESRRLLQATSLELLSSVSLTTNLPDPQPHATTTPTRHLGRPQARH